MRKQSLKSEKKVDWTWSMAVEIAKTEELMNQLLDQYVLEFGFQSIPKRVEILKIGRSVLI